MALSSEQYSTLKALALADQTASAILAEGNDTALAEWFNTLTTSYIWRTTVPVDDVFNAITWASLTPADEPDGTAFYTNRALLCQAKQINLQILLQGRERIATSKTVVRNGLSDALLNVPSGAGGAVQSAGWASVKSAISRLGTRAEMALASGSGTQANPSTPTLDGMLSSTECIYIRNS